MPHLLISVLDFLYRHSRARWVLLAFSPLVAATALPRGLSEPEHFIAGSVMALIAVELAVGYYRFVFGLPPIPGHAVKQKA